MEGFKCVAYGFGLGDSPQATAGFRMQFGQTLGGRFGPDGFSTLQRCLKEESKTPGLRSALAVVRLSQHDPDVLYKFKQVFIDKVPHASDKLQSDIRHDMQKVYACYFPLLPSKDVSFEIGRIYMGLKDFEIAVGFFKASQVHCGVHHVSWYNMGVCHYYLNELDSAAKCFDESLALCSDYPDAIKWRRKVDHLKEFLGDEPQRAIPRNESSNVNSGAGLTPRVVPNTHRRISSRRL
jgi:tetratricopeptide (TPR) repeat protein